jgi:hypothetical protein
MVGFGFKKWWDLVHFWISVRFFCVLGTWGHFGEFINYYLNEYNIILYNIDQTTIMTNMTGDDEPIYISIYDRPKRSIGRPKKILISDDIDKPKRSAGRPKLSISDDEMRIRRNKQNAQSRNKNYEYYSLQDRLLKEAKRQAKTNIV